MIKHCGRCGRILTEEEEKYNLCEECQYYEIAERTPTDRFQLTKRENELIRKHFKKIDEW